jgi:hypothetical protein
VGKPARNRPFRRPKHKWEDNIKMDVSKLGLGAWTGMIWLGIETCDRLLRKL